MNGTESFGGLTPLHWAVMGCTVPNRSQFGPSLEVISYLIAAGSDIHHVDGTIRYRVMVMGQCFVPLHEP